MLRKNTEETTDNIRYQQKVLSELSSGMRVEVVSLDNRLIFVGRLTKLDRYILQVTEENERSVPPVEYNSKVKIRGFKKDGSFSLVGMICGSAETFWRFDRFESFQVSDKRAYFRQNSSIEAWVMCVNCLFNPHGDLPEKEMKRFPCKIQDISGGGAMVRCKEQFEVGDWIFLTGESPVPNDGAFSFTCRVQRVTEGRMHNDYGCQFMGLTSKEQDRLMRMILLLQRKELQERRNREK